MVEPIPAETVEEIVGTKRHSTDHIVRLDSKTQQTYMLHSFECLVKGGGLPDPDCDYTAAQEKGVLDNLGDWECCEDQPVVVDIDETDDVLTPRFVEIPDDEQFAPGSRVKVKRNAVDVGDGHPGGEYIIESYVTAKHRDVALPYYMANGADGDMYGGCLPHAALEQVATAEEHAEQMKMPEPQDLMKAIASSLHSMFGEEIEIYETSLLKKAPKKNEWPEGKHPFKNGVEFVGKTEGGRRFAGTLRLTSLYEADA